MAKSRLEFPTFSWDGHEAELVDLPVEAQGIYRQVLHMHKDAKNTKHPRYAWGCLGICSPWLCQNSY